MAGRQKPLAAKGHPVRVRVTTVQQRQALQLRAAGASYRDIARQMSLDASWVYRLVQAGIANVEAEGVDELRRMEGHRLDQLTRNLWQVAFDTSRDDTARIRASAELRKISERRAKLFGLDHSDDIAEREMRLREEAGAVIADRLEALLEALDRTDETSRAAAVAWLGTLDHATPAAIDAAPFDIVDADIVEDTG